MTATYWQIGRRIVEQEQKGSTRASYGEELVAKPAKDLTARFGRGFSRTNVSDAAVLSCVLRENPDTVWIIPFPFGAASVMVLLRSPAARRWLFCPDFKASCPIEPFSAIHEQLSY